MPEDLTSLYSIDVEDDWGSAAGDSGYASDQENDSSDDEEIDNIRVRISDYSSFNGS